MVSAHAPAVVVGLRDAANACAPEQAALRARLEQAADLIALLYTELQRERELAAHPSGYMLSPELVGIILGALGESADLIGRHGYTGIQQLLSDVYARVSAVVGITPAQQEVCHAH